MSIDLFSIREQEIFKTLQELTDCNFVIIGGYAVNAYTLPRFSVDCDLVIPNTKELSKIELILFQRGYEKIKLPKNLSYSGHFCRYEKMLENNFIVSMDILINQVIDRTTNSTFSFDWIFNNSDKIFLKGKTITQEFKTRIINLDALIVMKIIANRSTDLRDIFMIFPHARSHDWIRSEIKSRSNFNDLLEKVKVKISSKQFRDDLSGVFGFIDPKVFEKHKNALLLFK
jgi:hypothetical protein